jgi:hypothetical protein
MSQVSVGQEGLDGEKARNENVSPAIKPGAESSKTFGEFGKEGTNKTIPEPKPDGAPSEELGNTAVKHVEKTPYTRG